MHLSQVSCTDSKEKLLHEFTNGYFMKNHLLSAPGCKHIPFLPGIIFLNRICLHIYNLHFACSQYSVESPTQLILLPKKSDVARLSNGEVVSITARRYKDQLVTDSEKNYGDAIKYFPAAK